MATTDLALGYVGQALNRNRTPASGLNLSADERAEWEEMLRGRGYSDDQIAKMLAGETVHGNGGFQFQVGGGNNPAAGGPMQFRPNIEASIGGSSGAGYQSPSERGALFGPHPDDIAPPPGQEGGDGFLTNVGKFIGDNPEIVGGVLETGANIYGGIQQDKRAKEALELQQRAQEERERAQKKQEEQQRLMMLLQALS